MPRPFTFVHAADLHIDSRFIAWAGAPDAVRSTLLESTHRAFRNLIKLCLERKANFLVVAGDVYEAADRSVRAQLRFRDGLAELGDHGISSFVVHGNHDPLDGWANTIGFPASTTIFGPNPSWSVASDDAGPIAQLQGMSYPTQDVTENVVSRFTAPESNGLFSIGLLHCNLGGNPSHGNYAPCSVADLERIGLDYWALGHIHRRAIVKASRPAIVYAGNTQGRDMQETGPRGCYVVRVDGARDIDAEFVPLDTVRWEQSEVRIDSARTMDDVLLAIDQKISELRAGSNGRPVVCRLGLTGRGPVHDELARDGAVDDLLAHLRDGFVPDSHWVWIDGLEDKTRPVIDIEARSHELDFLGLLLSRAQSTLEGRPGITEMSRDVNAALKTSRDRDGLSQIGETEARQLLDEARWLLAERLEGPSR